MFTDSPETEYLESCKTYHSVGPLLPSWQVSSKTKSQRPVLSPSRRLLTEDKRKPGYFQSLSSLISRAGETPAARKPPSPRDVPVPDTLGNSLSLSCLSPFPKKEEAQILSSSLDRACLPVSQSERTKQTYASTCLRETPAVQTERRFVEETAKDRRPFVIDHPVNRYQSSASLSRKGSKDSKQNPKRRLCLYICFLFLLFLTSSSTSLVEINPSLVELSLAKQSLRDQGIKILVPYLKMNYGLRTLDLSCNQIT